MPLGANKAALFGMGGVSSGGAIVFLATASSGGATNIEFDSLIDATYAEYIFELQKIHSANDGASFTYQAGASYNTLITSGAFRAENTESGGENFGEAFAANAQANTQLEQIIFHEMDNDNDSSVCGVFHLFNPGSTVFGKPWYARCQGTKNSNTSMEVYTSGVLNIAAALTQIRFTVASGSMETGTISMYGVK